MLPTLIAAYGENPRYIYPQSELPPSELLLSFLLRCDFLVRVKCTSFRLLMLT